MAEETGVEVADLVAELCEVEFEREGVGLLEGVGGVLFGVDAVEEETGEESVFGVFEECCGLFGGAAEADREVGVGDVEVLLVGFAAEGDGLAVEGFAEEVGEVAATESEGESVGFGFEDESSAVVFGDVFVHGWRTAVCGDDEAVDRGRVGEVGGVGDAGALVGGEFVDVAVEPVFTNGLRLFEDEVVEGFDKVVAEF